MFMIIKFGGRYLAWDGDYHYTVPHCMGLLPQSTGMAIDREMSAVKSPQHSAAHLKAFDFNRGGSRPDGGSVS